MAKRLIVMAGIICIFLTSGSVGAADKFRIGISTWAGYPDNIQGFRDGLAAEGLKEGQNIEFLIGESGGNKEKQREIAELFKKEGVHLVYSVTTPGTLVMKEIMPPATPIVFSVVSFPVEVGFVRSYERSGTNMVGTSNYIEPQHFLKLLRTILPNAKTVAIFRRKNEPNSSIQRNHLIPVLANGGIKCIDLPGESAEELRLKAIQNADKADVFIATMDTLINGGGGEEALIKVSLEKKIPILSSNKSGIEKGSSFGPAADFYVLGQMSAKQAVKILKEKANPAELRSAVQEIPLILINKTSVRALGISIPEEKLKNFRYVE